MNRFDFTGLALYLTFGFVLSASGHSESDITYWLLFLLYVVTDVYSSNRAYARGLTDGGNTVKKIWGIK